MLRSWIHSRFFFFFFLIKYVIYVQISSQTYEDLINEAQHVWREDNPNILKFRVF